MAGVGKAPNPNKEPVQKWLVQQHDKKPFTKLAEAIKAGQVQFKDTGVKDATWRLWVLDAIPELKGTPRGAGGRPTGGRANTRTTITSEPQTFDAWQAQLDFFKSRGVHMLQNEWNQIQQEEAALKARKESFDSKIALVAENTGRTPQAIKKELQQAQQEATQKGQEASAKG